ncbi:MAG: tetratricopeptide repeat protein, partial [Acetatifactor sp.]|nr:tetratricopeptide repeat protein [Acetatifactor sp.]
MNMQEIISQIDKLLEDNKREEAEKLMQESIARAVAEQDDSSLLRLLNELLGFYRETGRHEEAWLIADRAIAQAERMGLAGTIPYATTQLNVANAYRAGGRLEESLEKYLQVQEIYRQQLAPDDMLAASFQNNFSLLYQELGEYGKARECLLNALQIVKEKGSGYELGVTYANLAATCVQLEQMEEAGGYAAKSMEVFEKAGIMDSHYAAALSALGAWHFHRREYRAAGDAYRKAMELVERCNGRNHAYLRLKENAEACELEYASAAGDEEKQVNAAETGADMIGAGEKPAGIGLALSREYYETYGVPMIREQFGGYEGRIA